MHSYGQLSEPGLAVAAFDEMRRLGFWQPNDVRTANALLNALHADTDAAYLKYAALRSRINKSIATSGQKMIVCCGG